MPLEHPKMKNAKSITETLIESKAEYLSVRWDNDNFL